MSQSRCLRWFLVSFVVSTAGAHATLLKNGDFSHGLTHWTPWTVRDGNGDLAISTGGGELGITGTDVEAGVYQTLDALAPGHVVTVTGSWRSGPTLPEAQWAEVWVINADRVPIDGTAEIDGLNGAVLLYRNDTFGGRGAWDGPIPRTAPVRYRVSFVAAGTRATLILRAGNTGPNTPTGVRFDNLQVRSVPPPATPGALPAGFTIRTLTFPVSNMVSIAQSPVSGHIYAVSNHPTAADTRLYRIESGGAQMTAVPVPGVAGLIDYAQGLAFDTSGNLYISTQYGRIFRGIDTHPDPAADSFVFSLILAMPPMQLGTFHGVGGIAVGPDGLLYINSGSESHYGYLSNGQPEIFDGRLNARILRCRLDGSDLHTFAAGIRNSFDIAFRQDGRLFGVENGPNTGCDYAEEFNLLEAGHHYGFPYRYGSDLSGSDSSYTCTGVGTAGPPPLPPGLTPTPAWANYGPDAVPGPGQPGYTDGGVYFGFHPHSSPDGIDFYEPALMDPQAIKFPAEFHHRAFVARFGNLEPVPSVGYDVLSLRLIDAEEGFICNRFLGGLGRAIDVLCARNGRLYVLEYNPQTSAGGPGWGGLSRLYEIAWTVPWEPQVQVNPAGLSRVAAVGWNLPDDIITVSNAGVGILQFQVSVDQTWLSVHPAVGTSSGLSEQVPVTVSYQVGALPPGIYRALIRVSDPAASNSPQTVAVEVQVRTSRADFDTDGDVDLEDYGHFQVCMSGTGVIQADPACADARLDGDQDVDANDLARFRGCLSGAGVPAVPSCAD